MKRRELLRRLGAGVLGGTIASRSAQTEAIWGEGAGKCAIIPEETAGPFGIDFSENRKYFRREIAEGRPGIPLDLSLTVTNANDGCSPIANARVDVWHCDRDGVYSGFSSQPDGVDARGETFCRGIQLSDAEDRVEFRTIYPGWYPGRVTHIHLQAFLNNGLVATSQLVFPDAVNEAVYKNDAYPRGRNGRIPTNASDWIISTPPGPMDLQTATTLPNDETGGYSASLLVPIAV